jgi:hypothetical protein
MAAVCLLCLAGPAAAQVIQQGPKLVGQGFLNVPGQGFSVALSSDGNTAIVGGPADDQNTGAAWVFTRSNGAWSQQTKLIGNDAVGPGGQQGTAVALSADGNTAIVGGYLDNSGIGAAWVFIRSNGVWSQQTKLIGNQIVGPTALQGMAVALSADGNTAIVGGSGDNSGVGAAWIFTRSNGLWSQQTKLCARDSVGQAEQGFAVALSADGTAALVGGPVDNYGIGAAWVYKLSNGTWAEQTKLIANDAIGAADQGSALALSADGNTAIVGGAGDNSTFGAAWIWSQSSGVWAEQTKLIGAGAIGTALQGYSVALSGDGSTAIVGGPADDNPTVGAAWMFVQHAGAWSQVSKLVGNGVVGHAAQGTAVALSNDGSTAIVGGDNDQFGIGAAWAFVLHNVLASHDFDGDGKSDILWRDTSGNLAIWFMNGAQVLASSGVAAVPNVWSIVGQRDFNGDGNADILWRDTAGNLDTWFMNGVVITPSPGLGAVTANWSIAGTGDFNGDHDGDILWHDTSGNVALWLMNGASIAQSCGVGSAPPSWSIAGVGDFNGDGNADILWHDSSGNVAIWFMNGCSVIQSSGVGNAAPGVWSIAGTGDFNGDGKADILWHDTSGNVAMWMMNGASVQQSAGVGNASPSVWSIDETGDFNGDGMSDILWRDTSGNVAVWEMNGAAISQSAGIGNASASVWTIQGLNAD